MCHQFYETQNAIKQVLENVTDRLKVCIETSIYMSQNLKIYMLTMLWNKIKFLHPQHPTDISTNPKKQNSRETNQILRLGAKRMVERISTLFGPVLNSIKVAFRQIRIQNKYLLRNANCTTRTNIQNTIC